MVPSTGRARRRRGSVQIVYSSARTAKADSAASLFLRLKGDVIRLDGIDRAMETAEAISPLIPAAPDSLEAMWEGFAAQREAVLLFGNDDIAERLEFFYDKIRSLRGWFDNWHSEEQARLSIGNPNVAEITRRAAFARQWVTGHLGTGRRLLDDVANLIGEQRPSLTLSKNFPSSAPKEGPPPAGVKSNG